MTIFKKNINQHNPIKIGDWEYYSDKAALHKNEQQVRLEPIMAKALELFISKPNQVITKEELRDKVWEQEFTSDESVARCISRLRKALNDSSHSPMYIQTLPKKGYLFIASVQTPLSSSSFPKRTYYLAGGLILLLACVLLTVKFTQSSKANVASKRSSYSPKMQQADYFIRQKTPHSMRKAKDLLLAASHNLPENKEAFALLALVYCHNYGYHFKIPFEQRKSKAHFYIQKATKISPQSPLTWAARGAYAYYFESNFAKASQALQKSISLDPNSPWSHHLYAWVLVSQQKFTESIYRINQANKIDATSEGILWDKVWIHYLAKQNDQALTHLKEALNFSEIPHGWIQMLVYHQVPNHLQAARLWVKRNLNSGYSQAEMSPAIQAINQGNWKQCYEHFIQLNKKPRQEFEDPEAIAIWNIVIGNNLEAQKQLDKARKNPHRLFSPMLHLMPIFAPINQ